MSTASPSRTFAWVVFALIFGLLLSDYMSRQVLNAVFPLLKSEWSLSDTQLGSLSSVVSLMVGLLTFPLSLVADRWGRVASLKAMALLWSLATLACGFARNYEEMFAARFMIGVGEAAYGSVGIAVILSVFPPHLRSTLSGSFLAGGVFGSVLGMGIGGAVAARMGWRWSFIAMACFGLVLLVAFALAVTEKRLDPQRRHAARMAQSKHLFQFKSLLPGLFSARSVIFAYLGNGLQLFIVGSLIAWMPSFLNREYGLATARASAMAAAFVLLSGVGMINMQMQSSTDHVSLRGSSCASSRIAIQVAVALRHLRAPRRGLSPGPEPPQHRADRPLGSVPRGRDHGASIPASAGRERDSYLDPVFDRVPCALARQQFAGDGAGARGDRHARRPLRPRGRLRDRALYLRGGGGVLRPGRTPLRERHRAAQDCYAGHQW